MAKVVIRKVLYWVFEHWQLVEDISSVYIVGFCLLLIALWLCCTVETVDSSESFFLYILLFQHNYFFILYYNIFLALISSWLLVFIIFFYIKQNVIIEIYFIILTSYSVFHSTFKNNFFRNKFMLSIRSSALYIYFGGADKLELIC